MTESLRRSRLFLGSYALLFLLLAIRFETIWLEVVCGALAVAGFLDMLWIVFGIARRTSADPIRLAKVEDAGPEVAGYLATYLLPFLTVPQPTVRDVAAYTIFLMVTGLVYVRSEMAQINPTLYILGRRGARGTTHQGPSGPPLVRNRLPPAAALRAVSLHPTA